MPKLWEALTPTSKRLAAELAREAIMRMGTETNSYSLPIRNRHLRQEIGAPIVAAVHLAMWEDAIPNPNLPAPYKRVLPARQEYAVSRYLRRLFRGLDTPTDNQITHLTRQVIAQLATNQAARRIMDKGKSGRGVYPMAVAPPGPIHIEHGVTRTPAREQALTWTEEMQLERRVEETRRPVATTFDISAIPPPDPTPESVMAYVRKLRGAYTTLLERHHKVAVERDELAERLEKYLEDEKRKAEEGDWAKVVREITASRAEET